VAAAVLIGFALLRIAATYSIFNHTIDEGAHLACGLQWFQGLYNYDPKHTPIARIFIAALPYLDGLRSHADPSYWREGVLDLSTGGHYWRNLTLARLGVLPFFVLAVAMVYVWTKHIFDPPTALLAAGIFTVLPVVLGHSAVATTDIPLTAMFLVALYGFTRWLEAPTWRTAGALGLATGLAVATKLSTLVFLPAAAVGLLPFYLMQRRRDRRAAGTVLPRWRLSVLIGHVLIGSLGLVLVIWVAYRFSSAPIAQISAAPDRIATRLFGPGSGGEHAVHAVTATIPLPAPDFFAGLRDLLEINNLGARSYLFGQVRVGGWWYFYPVAIALKTPLAVLLLALIGAAALAVAWLRSQVSWVGLAPSVATAALFIVVAPTHLDIGVRHVMPIFAFLSMMAAVGTCWLWRLGASRRDTTGRRTPGSLVVSRAAPIVLLIWTTVASAQAHPDYLAYFNELAGRTPANILVISDVDWGQDFARLASYLHNQHVDRLSVAAENLFDPSALGLPATQRLKCGEAATGWIAVEERRVRVFPECYRWLAAESITAFVGKSIRVYHIPASARAAPL